MGYSLVMIIIAVLMHFAHLYTENFSLQVKLGFTSKILLVSGIIGLWIFGISDMMKKRKSK